jgi:hypothetical protein
MKSPKNMDDHLDGTSEFSMMNGGTLQSNMDHQRFEVPPIPSEFDLEEAMNHPNLRMHPGGFGKRVIIPTLRKTEDVSSLPNESPPYNNESAGPLSFYSSGAALPKPEKRASPSKLFTLG